MFRDDGTDSFGPWYLMGDLTLFSFVFFSSFLLAIIFLFGVWNGDAGEVVPCEAIIEWRIRKEDGAGEKNVFRVS